MLNEKKRCVKTVSDFIVNNKLPENESKQMVNW